MQPLLERIWDLEKRGDISFHKGDENRYMSYVGTMADAVHRVERALQRPLERESAMYLFLYLPRLLAATIDYELATGTHLLFLKDSIEDLAIDAFAGKYRQAAEKLEGISSYTAEIDMHLIERPDMISWHSYQPKRVDSLIAKIYDANIDAFVIDGHDGYRVGFMVAAACDKPTWAVKNTTDKHNGHTPRVLAGEATRLQQMLATKRVCILGEDISTGGAAMALHDLLNPQNDPRRIQFACSIWMPPTEHLPKGRPDYYGVKKIAF